MRALLAMPEGLQHRMFTPAQLETLAGLVEIDVERTSADLGALPAAELAPIDLLLTGWGSPRLDAGTLARLPRLRTVVHTAGTVRFVASAALWERGDVAVSSATFANAVPVAEFTLAQILLAGKRSLAQEAHYRVARGDRSALPPTEEIGNYGAVVGLIGASTIGRMVAEHLRGFAVEVLLADPTVDAAEVAALGARKVELEELFSRSDVVSLHAPDVPSTRGMIGRELLALLRDGGTFLNTARPALVDLDALREELVSGRLAAVLDVNDDLSPEDPLWQAPAVSITPHLAGSRGNELHRMGALALEEVRRAAAGEDLAHPVDASRLDLIA